MESLVKKMTLKFDSTNMRRTSNNFQVAAHCFHYSMLITQLAIDSKKEETLISSSEDTFLEYITSLIPNEASFTEKLKLMCEIFSRIGFGKIEPVFIAKDFGEFKLTRSHFDEGWLKKWGKSDRPVNLIGYGYISAMFSILFDLPRKSFRTLETTSICKGERFSYINIYKV